MIAVVVVAAGLVAVELALRASLPQAPVASAPTLVAYPGYSVFTANSRFTFVNESGANVIIATDENGLRNPPDSLAGASVVVLGDSFVAADNTPEGETLVGRLRESGLAAYNAGVDGSSTFNQFYLMRDHLREAQVGRVYVLLFYLGNDFRDNYWTAGPVPEPERAPAALAAPAVSAAVDWTGMCRALLTCRIVRDRVWLGLVQKQQTDPMGSYALSQILTLRTVEPAAITAARDRTRAALSGLTGKIHARGGKLLVVGLPSKAEVMRSFREISGFAGDPAAASEAQAALASGFSWDKADTMLDAVCAELSIPYLPLLPTMRRAQAVQPLYFDFDVHWRAAGQLVAADEILAFLRRNHWDGSPRPL